MTTDHMDIAKEILSGCLFVPKEKIEDDADISQLGDMNSLTFETLVLQIEQWTGKEADVESLLSLRSVRDLADILAKAR